MRDDSVTYMYFSPTTPISFLFHLLDILIHNISEVLPATLRDEDTVAVIALYLRNRHVATLLVLLDVKEEVLVLDPEVLVLGALDCLLCVTIVILLNQLANVLLELSHALGRDEHLEPVVAAGESLGHLEESSTSILLQIHVVFFIVFVHHLGLEFSLLQVVRINLAETLIEVNELQKVLTEQSSSGKGHQNLILSSICRNLCHLDEPSSLILLDVQVEPFALQD